MTYAVIALTAFVAGEAALVWFTLRLLAARG